MRPVFGYVCCQLSLCQRVLCMRRTNGVVDLNGNLSMMAKKHICLPRESNRHPGCRKSLFSRHELSSFWVISIALWGRTLGILPSLALEPVSKLLVLLVRSEIRQRLSNAVTLTTSTRTCLRQKESGVFCLCIFTVIGSWSSHTTDTVRRKPPWPLGREQTIPTERPPLVDEIKDKVKLYLCLTKSPVRYEDVWWSGDIDPRIFYLGTNWGWVFGFMPQPL
jgi:hypothetical protein